MSQATPTIKVDAPALPAAFARNKSKHVLEQATEIVTSQNLFLFLIAFRILNALSIKTFFQPDEYFQSLEPAWEIAFGAESGAWITWEWKNNLRSAIYPSLFAAVYWLSSSLTRLLSLSPDSRAEVLIAAPKMVQAVFAALGDYYTWMLAKRIYGPGSNEAWTALALTVCSPWQWFASTRTLSNCLETTLTIVALHFWPWEWFLGRTATANGGEDNLREDESPVYPDELAMLRRALLLAAFACILRPTNILIWVCIASFAVLRTKRSGLWAPLSWADTFTGRRQTKLLVRETVLCGSLVFALSILVDRLYYQQWTFPPYRLLYFNIAQSLAVFYGHNDWHYYLSQGYPLLLTTFLPFGLIGLYQSISYSKSLSSEGATSKPSAITIRCQLATVATFVPLVLSFISHKEVRFIYPLLPLMHILAAAPFTTFFLPTILAQPTYLTAKRLLLVFLLLTNITISLLTTTSHQPAPINVLHYLRTQHMVHYLSKPHPATLPPPPLLMTVGFLTPCHSTPWRSHLVHPSIKAWALSCDPPLHLKASARAAYLDEADRFYADPRAFLATALGKPPPSKPKFFGRTPPRKRLVEDESLMREGGWDGKEGRKMWPEYVVFFAQLEDTMRGVLRGSAYRECWRGWNGWGNEDWRRRGDMVVWCLQGEGEGEA